MSFASSGLGAWILQRLTAIYLLVFSSYVVFQIAANNITTAEQWQILSEDRFVLLTTGIAMLSILAHGWVGVRDIIMDYVKPLALRLVMYAIVVLYMLYIVLWAFNILWNI